MISRPSSVSLAVEVSTIPGVDFVSGFGGVELAYQEVGEGRPLLLMHAITVSERCGGATSKPGLRLELPT
jgi:hypothetical protein